MMMLCITFLPWGFYSSVDRLQIYSGVDADDIVLQYFPSGNNLSAKRISEASTSPMDRSSTILKVLELPPIERLLFQAARLRVINYWSRVFWQVEMAQSSLLQLKHFQKNLCVTGAFVLRLRSLVLPDLRMCLGFLPYLPWPAYRVSLVLFLLHWSSSFFQIDCRKFDFPAVFPLSFAASCMASSRSDIIKADNCL